MWHESGVVRLCTKSRLPDPHLDERKISPPCRGVDVRAGSPPCLPRALRQLGDPFAAPSAAFSPAFLVCEAAGGISEADILSARALFGARVSLPPLHPPLCPPLSVKHAVVVSVQLAVFERILLPPVNKGKGLLLGTSRMFGRLREIVI